MKQTIKRLAGFAGYEISRKPARSAEPGKAALVDAVLKKCDVPILEPRAYAEYRKACAPLFPEPARVPAEFPLAHYQNVAKAVQNESMSGYFNVAQKDRAYWITDDYAGAPYHSRQRMLQAVYEKYWPGSLRGASTLDIGCSSGYYSFFLSRAGAGPVLGIDARPEHQDQFRLLHHMLKLPASCRYETADMENGMENLPDSYDLVLAQGVMYHVYDHPRFIRNLYRLTRRILVLEGACSGCSDNLCAAVMEDTANLRASIHGPVIFPSLSWMIELLRWVGFKEVLYVNLPDGVKDTWGFDRLERAMLVALK